jgi:hypothetical protein
VRVAPLEILAARLAEAERYLEACERFAAKAWEELHKAYKAGTLSLPEKIALIHPRHYEEQEAIGGLAVRGAKTFLVDRHRHDLSCEATKVWMQPCRLSQYEVVHADHFFPYSLGGPTVPENRISLCPLHNQLKTNDVHFFPWELGEPCWLSEHVERIRHLLSA